jgi:hypothetical protein
MWQVNMKTCTISLAIRHVQMKITMKYLKHQSKWLKVKKDADIYQILVNLCRNLYISSGNIKQHSHSK